jgi:hypothetical protein
MCSVESGVAPLLPSANTAIVFYEQPPPDKEDLAGIVVSEMAYSAISDAGPFGE